MPGRLSLACQPLATGVDACRGRKRGGEYIAIVPAEKLRAGVRRKAAGLREQFLHQRATRRVGQLRPTDDQQAGVVALATRCRRTDAQK